MAGAIALGVAAAYAVSVVGLHRRSVWRRRERAGGFPTLRWIDWDTLLAPVIPGEGEGGGGPTPPEGGPGPVSLGRLPSGDRRRTLLWALVGGARVEAPAIEAAGFQGSDAAWVDVLTRMRGAPAAVLEQLSAAPAGTLAAAYLREVLELETALTPWGLEWSVFTSKRRIAAALGRFGHHPALYFVRARASSVLGWQGQVLDDLARAVYFSREAAFYLSAVTEAAFVQEARPALARACQNVQERKALARAAEAGNNPA